MQKPEERKTISMREAIDQGPPSIPIVRIWMFGEFVVEHFIPSEEYSPRYEPLAPSSWQSRGTALTLLKVLLCRRRRRATKDELIAAIWPQKEEGAKHLKHVERAFDAAASVLRAVLRTPEGESLLMSRRSGDHMLYRLADQQRLWTDAEACELLVNQAIQMEGQGQTHEGLAVWEEAYRLTQRGVFLEDDVQASWSQARRQMVEGTERFCVHHLADCYLALDRHAEAEVILRSFWTANPTDEDALYRLMKLLAQHTRVQEALRLFSYTERLLQQEEARHPSERLLRFAEHIRRAEET
jgi:DNA-binding SARP family transcriptional activator